MLNVRWNKWLKYFLILLIFLWRGKHDDAMLVGEIILLPFFLLYQLESAPSFLSIFLLSQTKTSLMMRAASNLHYQNVLCLNFFIIFFLMQSKKSRPAIVATVKLWLNNKSRDDTLTPYFHRRLLFVSGPEGDKVATGVTRRAQAPCRKGVTARWRTASRTAPLDVFPVVEASSLPALLSDLPATF